MNSIPDLPYVLGRFIDASPKVCQNMAQLMGKTIQALENWHSGKFKTRRQAALAAGCHVSVLYRALQRYEKADPRRCPCCEQRLDKRVALPVNRFKAVNDFLDQLEQENQKIEE